MGQALQKACTGGLSWGSQCIFFHGEGSPGADVQLSIETTLWGHNSLCDYLVAQMNMEDRKKLLSLRKQINLQKGQENRLICLKEETRW